MFQFDKEFIGQYELSKTLKFELKPVGQTLANMQSAKLFEKDLERSSNYQLIKKILDDYYRWYIEQALKGKSINGQSIRAAYEAYVAGEIKVYTEINAMLFKELATNFNDRKNYGFGKLKDLFSLEKPGEISLFRQWIINNSRYTDADKQNYLSILDTFNGFSGYFSDYNKNRENMFTPSDQETSVCNRVIGTNMYLYFDNVKYFEKIKNKYPDLYTMLEKWQSCFVPENFGTILSQSAIDNYNYNVIGSPANEPDATGVNTIINRYRQENKIESKFLHPMVRLQKQILSDKPSVIPVIETQEEAISLVKINYRKLQEIKNKLQTLIEDQITPETINTIYLRSIILNKISNDIYKDWSFISNAKDIYIQFLSEKEQKAFHENQWNKAVSLATLIQIITGYKKVKSGEPESIMEKDIIFDLITYFKNAPEFTVDISKINTSNIINYKTVLDNMEEFIRFYKMFSLYDGKKKINITTKNDYFYNTFDSIYEELRAISKDYDKIRNFATKKVKDENKIKLNFENAQLLNGWDMNTEKNYHSVLFEKNNKYYLGILDSKAGSIFNFNKPEIMAKAKQPGPVYHKMMYKQIGGANKMLPKYAKELAGKHSLPDNIREIYEKKLYVKEAQNPDAMYAWIDWCKEQLVTNPNWANYYTFNLLDSRQYLNMNEFYTAVDNQAYFIRWTDVSEAYINELIATGKLYFYQIYHMDFSDNRAKPGTDSMHTLYWKAIFKPENNKKEGPIFKLNGNGEIFWRKASIERYITHPKNQPLQNKNPLNSKRESIFTYDLIKNKRFTEDKYFFHVPITINFRAGNNSYKYNEKVNRYVAENKNVNIISIDRGERHLLYYTVINRQGKILEQGSFNKIHAQHTADGQIVGTVTDYKKLLEKKEKERADARLAWETIGNIKELKTGYLSQAIYQVTKLMDKYNAVIVMENLNTNFKRGRMAIEKQVYQNFEKALINKLNYLVFKDKTHNENGSYANGYQLTAPFDGFERLGRQTGFIYYVDPAYTTKIDPRTGFVPLKGINTVFGYTNISLAKKALEKLTSFRYNSDKNYFEIIINYNNYTETDPELSIWTICTHGQDRYTYNSQTKQYENHNITKELKDIFEAKNINYQKGQNILPDILQQNDKPFYQTLLMLIRLVMQLRYFKSADLGNDDDFILSPVQDKNGHFFDSRYADEGEPESGNANGSYHIALKGLKIITGITDGKLPALQKNQEQNLWLKYVKTKPYLD